MKKGQSVPALTSIVLALVIPLLILIMYVINVSVTNATEGVITISVTDYFLAAGLNNTALSLGQNYLYEDASLTFNETGLTEDVNYTVDWTAGTVTWVGPSNENSSAYDIDYEYFMDANRLTFDSISSNADDSYDMAGILPIAIIGIVVLSMIVGAIGGFAYLKNR